MDSKEFDFDKFAQEYGDVDDGVSLEKIRGLTDLMTKYKEKMNSLPFKNGRGSVERENRERDFNRAYENILKDKGLKNIHQILPYVDLKYHKGILIYTKLQEVDILQEMYAKNQMEYRDSKRKNKDVLWLLMESLPSEQKQKMDNMYQMIGLMEIFKEMNINGDFNENKVVENSANLYEGGFFDEKFRL